LDVNASNSEGREMRYVLRVAGTTKLYFNVIGEREINEYLRVSKENPAEKVEIVSITESVVLGGYEYGLMERHFNKVKEVEK